MTTTAQRTIRFSHPFGRELDADIQAKYDRTAISTPNFAILRDVADRAVVKVTQTAIQGFLDRQEREREWEVFIALYKGVRLSGMVHSNAEVNVPQSYQIIETWTRKLVRATFNRDPWFTAGGFTRLEEQNGEKIVEFMIDQLRQTKFPINWKRWCRTLVMLGTSPALVSWDYARRKINFAERFIEDRKERGVTIERFVRHKFPSEAKRTFVFDNPDFRPLRLFDFIGDQFTWDIQKGTYAAHRSILTRAKLKELQDRGGFLNVDQLDDRPGLSAQQKTDRVRRWIDYEPDQAVTVTATDEFEIIEYWGPFQTTPDDEEKEYVITMVKDHNIILRIQENPFWHGLRPYVVGQYVLDEDGKLYGIGIMEMIASLQIELNDTRNMNLNAKDLILNPMMQVSEDADVPDEHLYAEAGRVIRVRNIGQIAPIAFADPSLTGFRHEGAIKADMEETSSSPKSLVGAPQAGDETATENINRIREANEAVVEILADVSDNVLTPMLTMFYYLNMQFVREERVYRILGSASRRTGELFKVLQPEDLAGNYDFRIVGVRDFAVRGMRVQQMRGFLDAFSRFPKVQQQMDAVAVAKEVALDLFDEQRASLFFPDMRQDELMTPDEEHELIKLGRKVMPSDRDNHQAHIARHMAAINDPDARLDEGQLLFLIAHQENHILFLQRQQLAIDQAIQNAQTQARIQAAAQAGMAQPGPGGGQNGGGSRPRQVVPNEAAGQAAEAQQAQIGGEGPEGIT